MLNLSFRFQSAFRGARRSAAHALRLSRPQHGHTSASVCHPPHHQLERVTLRCQAVMLNALTSSPPRATTVPRLLRTNTQLAFHSYHQHTLPALQLTHPSPRPRATIHLIPQPMGTTTHTPQPTLHNHQSIPPPARRTHSTTNTQSANPTTPLKPIRTGRFSPPDRKQPQATRSRIATY